MIVSGQVERVSSYEGKFGPMYSITVGGEKYGTGKNSMGASEGDWVTFTATTNPKGYKDVDKGTLKPVEAPPQASTPAVANSSKAQNKYQDDRQDSIVYQSSRKDALHFLEILASQNLIEYGKAKGADKLAIIETYLDKFTEHFIAECKKGTPYPSQDLTEGKKAATLVDAGDDEQLPF